MTSTAIAGVSVAAVAAPLPAARQDRRADPANAAYSPLKRVARISEVTATYDARGNYPAYRLFQIARPVAEPAPFGALPVRLEERGRRRLIEGSYRRDESPYTGLVDRRL